MNTSTTKRNGWWLIGLSVVCYFTAMGIYMSGMTQPDDVCILKPTACLDVPAAFVEPDARGCRIRATFVINGRFAKLIFADGHQMHIPGDEVLVVQSFPLQQPTTPKKLLAGLVLLLAVVLLALAMRNIGKGGN
jgi:hypothetical protein